MKSNFIITIYGPVFPGMIKSLAETTRSMGGEWLASKVIKLEGQFSAIMNVVVAQDAEEKLKSGLEGKFPSLRFVYAEPGESPLAASKTIHLAVDCIDRPGLTGDVSNILANLDIVVEDMECKRFVMDGIGDTVFSARLTLSVPEAADSEVIAGEIEAMSEDVRVIVL